MALNYTKGSKSGPITIQFASNDEENQNWIKLARPTGKSLSRMEQLQRLVKLDPENPGKPEKALDYMQVMAIVMADCAIEWTLADADTGEAIPITPENIQELYAEDYTKLVNEFAGHMINLRQQAEPKQGEPKPEITVPEKNGLPDSSMTVSTASKTNGSLKMKLAQDEPLTSGNTPESIGLATEAIG